MTTNPYQDKLASWITPETSRYPIHHVELAPPKPFLVPSFDNKIVEVLPSSKPNRKINFDENVIVVEIENRFELFGAQSLEDQQQQLQQQQYENDNDSYEIEIVEDDGDADFYLEIVDGEVYYVFETEDDISLSDEEDSDEEEVAEGDTHAEDDGKGRSQPSLMGLIASTQVPDLDSSGPIEFEADEIPSDEEEFATTTKTAASPASASPAAVTATTTAAPTTTDHHVQDEKHDEDHEGDHNDEEEFIVIEGEPDEEVQHHQPKTEKKAAVAPEAQASVAPTPPLRPVVPAAAKKPEPVAKGKLQSIPPFVKPDVTTTTTPTESSRVAAAKASLSQAAARAFPTLPGSTKKTAVPPLVVTPETSGAESSAPAPAVIVKPTAATAPAVAPSVPSVAAPAQPIAAPIPAAPAQPSAVPVLSAPSSPTTVPGAPLFGQPLSPQSPNHLSASPKKSILKATPESSRKTLGSNNKKAGSAPNSPSTPRRSKKNKNKDGKDAPKKEKTFTKTYVRAEDYDGEHKPITWEKPQWTKAKLRSTGKGEEVRRGANLANPITFPKKKPANAELLESESEDNDHQEQGLEDSSTMEMEVDKQALVRKLMEGSGPSGTTCPITKLPRYKNHQQRKLKFSINGIKIRDGTDIVKPITKATVYRTTEENINKVANPTILKATAVGEDLRKGKSLAGPITEATARTEEDTVNKIANPDEVLKNRGVATARKTYQWSKPEWLTAKLNTTGEGEVLKSGGDVAAPITSSTSKDATGVKKEYQWQKPDWARKREEQEMETETTASSDEKTTSAEEKTAQVDGKKSDQKNSASFEPSKDFLLRTRSCHVSRDFSVRPQEAPKKKAYDWAKPDWTKKVPRGVVHEGKSLEKPITFPIGKGDGINKLVAPSEVLKPTKTGEVARQGAKLERPITTLPDELKRRDAVQ